ncbi:MAG: hypothetical protein ACFFEA_11685, partial [Candidatus Thorarchaeota archaeon]
MIIREATEADTKWVLRHRIGMFKAMGENEEFIQETTELAKEYLQGDWTGSYRYFFVEEDDEVIGGCGLSTFSLPPMATKRV